jgi:hypothetical protein
MWRIEFSSADFLPYLPEECQANPGAYGFELAHWLSMALARQGVATSYPQGEDWGWFIEYINGEIEVAVGCSSVAEEGDGYTGEAVTWSIFVKPQLSLKQRLKGSAADGVVQSLTQAVLGVLTANGIEVRHVGA